MHNACEMLTRDLANLVCRTRFIVCCIDVFGLFVLSLYCTCVSLFLSFFNVYAYLVYDLLY